MVDFAEPIPYTLLSLPRWAHILGISPLHFFRGVTPGLNPEVFPDVGCNDLWFKYDWQDYDKVSWTQVAQLISDAEEEIAQIVGYYPAPKWIEEEIRQQPRPFVRYAYGSGADIRGQYKSVNSRFGKFRQSGERAVTLVGTATTAGGTLVYSDEDSDGYFETATITLATALISVNEIKVYHAGEGGNPDWEVRPVKSKTISGGNVVIVLSSWLLVDPDLYEDYPTSDGLTGIDVSTTANFVTSVDVYREYADFTIRSALFYWERAIPSDTGFICSTCGGLGCVVCQYTTQEGCVNARDVDKSILVASPGTYDSENEHWDRVSFTECREPDFLKLWYQAGDVDQRYTQGYTHDPLSQFWAQTIAWLAAARLERPVCGCSNVQAVVDDLRLELTKSTREVRYFVTDDVMSSPFGHKKGEVMAWRRISRVLKDRRFGVAVI